MILTRKGEKHGKLSTYTGRNCRCGKCKEAMRLYKREYRRKEA